MKKFCSNCKYTDMDVSYYPCYDCVNNEHWEKMPEPKFEDLPEVTLEQFLAGKNVLKEVTKKYVIYDRDWLADNLDMEIESIKSYKSWKRKQAMRALDYLNSEEGKAALAEMRKGKK